MVEILAGAVLVFFAVLGIAEGWGTLKGYLLTPRDDRATFVVSCRGRDEQIEYFVRSLQARTEDMRFKYAPLIIVVDMGMDEETKDVCMRLQREIKGLKMCGRHELTTVLYGDLQN